MAGRILLTVFCALMAILACGLAYAEEKQPADDGFVTNTVNAVFDKVNQYTSGEKGIFIKDYDKPEERKEEYSTDALGRKIAEPKIRTTTKAPSAKEAKPAGPAD